MARGSTKSASRSRHPQLLFCLLWLSLEVRIEPISLVELVRRVLRPTEFLKRLPEVEVDNSILRIGLQCAFVCSYRVIVFRFSSQDKAQTVEKVGIVRPNVESFLDVWHSLVVPVSPR